MSVGIGVDAQGLLHRIRSIKSQCASQGQYAFVNGIQVFEAGNREVEVQLLGYRTVGPRRSRQLINPLEREARTSRRREQIQPIASRRIVVVGLRRFVSPAVDESEQRAPKLCAAARIGGVHHDLYELNGR